MSEHTCREQMHEAANSPHNPMCGLAGEMAVSTSAPTVTAREFPPTEMTCPHGQHMWAYPTRERIAALRALNDATNPARRPAPPDPAPVGPAITEDEVGCHETSNLLPSRTSGRVGA